MLALMFTPRVIDGDYYEILDPIVYFAVPFLVLCVGIGALVGAGPRATSSSAVLSRSATPRALALAATTIVVTLAAWTIAWATGVIETPPLGIG
ncbi:hypothetical protein [Kineosporia sp. R_H_3]|uniref:hypothetical protein n=1 Tax=Kineosporia sp. R_H_3 TaxID=1961848 RepID=UPI000B4BB42F|nr:hypothetical protein [Kineosporia sp. R_H_3]